MNRPERPDRNTQRELLRMQRMADEMRTDLMAWLMEGGWPTAYQATQALEHIRRLELDVDGEAAGLPVFLFNAAYCGMVSMLADTGLQRLEEMNDEQVDPFDG